MDTIIVGILFVTVFAFGYRKLQRQLDDVVAENQKLKQEIDELLAGYLLEIEEQNKELEKTLRGRAHAEMSRVPSTNFVHSAIATPRPLQSEASPINFSIEEANDEPQAVIDESSSLNKETMEELSLEAKVFFYESQGLSIEEIAKKLNKGKTEIELILKFHR